MKRQAVLCGTVALLASATGAGASVISSTPMLPVLGVPYASATGVGCFAAVNVCVAPGTLTFDSLVSSTFNLEGQDLVVNVSYASTLTTLSATPIGPVTLTGTIEEEVLGRTFDTELGSWTVDIVDLSLSGPVLGHTLTLSLDTSNSSSGTTSIVPFEGSGGTQFLIDSFFDVFVDLSLDTPTPLNTTRGPVRLTLPGAAATAVPEPSSLALLGGGLTAIVSLRRRKLATRAAPETRTA